MRLVPISSIVAAALLASVFEASAATTLRTPFVAASVDGACLVTNVSRKPIVVSGQLLDQLGGVHTVALDTCSAAPVEPGATCVVGAVTSSLPPGAIYFGFSCSIVASSSKVRAIAYGSSGPGTALAIVPATAK